MPRKKTLTSRCEELDPEALLMQPPPPPAHLGREAAAAWGEVATLLAQRCTLRGMHLHSLEILANGLATMRRTDAQLAAEGFTVPVRGGGRKTHPAVRIRNEASAEVRRLLIDFGLHPDGQNDSGPFSLGLLRLPSMGLRHTRN